MSTELHLNLNWIRSQEDNPLQRLEELLDAVQAANGGPLECTSLVCRRGVPGNIVLKNDSISGKSEAVDLLRDLAVEGLFVSLYASWPCWRFDAEAAYWGAVPLVIEVRHPDYGQKIGVEPFLEGAASIKFLNNNPFFGLLDENGEELVSERNDHVKANVERLLGLCQSIVRTSFPDVMLMASDTGQASLLPFAHLAWFSHPKVAAAHFDSLWKFLQKGSPANHIPPFQEWPVSQLRAFQHAYLSQERNTAVKAVLGNWLSRPCPISEAAIEAVLASGQMDYMESGDGFMVLEFPFLLNGILDGFFADVLLHQDCLN